MDKGRQLDATEALRKLKKLPHVNAREYFKLRGQVNARTQAIRRWLAYGPRDSRYLAESLSEIFKLLSDEPSFASRSAPFQLSLHGGSLPASLQGDMFYPHCRFAGDALACHLILLSKFIEIESIPVSGPALSDSLALPPYPRYDEWLVAAMGPPCQMESGETLDAEVNGFNAESVMDIKKIIAEAEKREAESRAMEACFAAACPICDELLYFRDILD